MSVLKDRKILIGVSGGIAIYKIVDLVSKLVKADAKVKVIMTKNATKFIAPLTFETISQNPVTVDLWEEERCFEMGHISNAKWGEILLIAPATANIIGKLASGIADDALTTLFISFNKKVLIAPSMNPLMWQNPAVKKNIEILKERGVTIIEPEVGRVACGDEGAGRLPEPSTLLKIFEDTFSQCYPLSDRKILVTAGPTREFFDPVRCITNPSTGKMGYAIAEEARNLGGDVILVSGPTQLPNPPFIHTERVQSASEMLETVLKRISECSICVFTAAVSDYRPEKTESHKIKKGDSSLMIKLIKNPDIAFEATKKKKKGMIFVGFAAETRDFIENAKKKLKEKSLDIIVVNNVLKKDIGFESDKNEVTFVFADGRIEKMPVLTKTEVAKELWKRIINLLKNRKRNKK